jgi:hypothetical protein
MLTKREEDAIGFPLKSDYQNTKQFQPLQRDFIMKIFPSPYVWGELCKWRGFIVKPKGKHFCGFCLILSSTAEADIPAHLYTI